MVGKQSLNLPPPGIEPGSPASQMGTLPKELSRQHIPVLRIRDGYPESPIPDPTFFYPGSRIRPVSIPDPGSASKNLSVLTPKKPKKWFLCSRKYDPSCSSWIPDPDADLLPIPDPGSQIKGSKRHRIPANYPPPPEYLLTQDSCKETSPPLLHTTHNNTSNAPHNDVAPLKIITYCAIKTTGTLIVSILYCRCRIFRPVRFSVTDPSIIKK